MADLKVHKVVSALPQVLEPDSVYLVRTGEGFDLYATNHSGTIISYPANYQPKNANLSALAAYPAPLTPGNLFALDPLTGWQSIGAGGGSGATLPALATENATFQDEGTSTAGWTATDMTMAVSGSVLRATKTNAAGVGAQITKPVTLPANGKDYILYVRMRANAGCVCWLNNAASDRLAILWLNAINSGAPSNGSLSITGYKADGTTQNLTFAEGFDTATAWLDVALHYDSKFGTLSIYQRRADGSLDYKGRVACDHNALNNVTFRTLSGAAAGSWIEFDYVQVCAPNLVVVGDSISEGKNGFSPNMSLGLNNYLTTWMNYARAYLGLRNNLIVGKGVGSQTSAMIKDRAADYAGIGAKVVFLHASSNDTVGGISQASRTANIQASVDAVKNSGAAVVLLNAVYGTSANNLQPGFRNYMNEWWTTHRLNLSRVDVAIDIMQPIRTADNYMRAEVTETDAIHPKAEGYRLIGQWIAGVSLAMLLSSEDKAKLDSLSTTYQTRSAAEGQRQRMPFPNIMPDGGRFAGKVDLTALTLSSEFAAGNYFPPYNGAVIASAGKFIHSNTADSQLTESVQSLLTAMGRTGDTRRYGVEFFVAGVTAGQGTTVPNAGADGVTRYLLMAMQRAIASAGNYATFVCWVRVKSGSAHLISESYIDGVYYGPSKVLPAGWRHLRITLSSTYGYFSQMPNIYAAPGSVLEFALPGYFSGDVDVGRHVIPLLGFNGVAS